MILTKNVLFMNPNMTAQEVFNKVVTHLRKQGKQSRDTMRCLYLSPEGLKCAVGCLIPPEDYRKDMEGKTFDCLLSDRYFHSSLIAKFNKHRDLLHRLQELHDCSSVYNILETWERGFIMIAKEFNLSIPIKA